MTKTAYSYDPNTGQYMSESVCNEDPRAGGEYLLPACATFEAPPAVDEGNAAIWKNGAWEIVSDNRGQSFWLPDGTHHTITELGEEVPDDALDTEPDLRTFEEKQYAALDELSGLHSLWLITATGNASAEERDTWGVKSTAAKAWNAGTADSDQTAMLQAEAEQRNSPVDELVTTILENSTAYHQLIGYARGALSFAEAAVNAATDQTGIDAAVSGFQTKVAGYGSE